jgi:hypothetical protein
MDAKIRLRSLFSPDLPVPQKPFDSSSILEPGCVQWVIDLLNDPGGEEILDMIPDKPSERLTQTDQFLMSERYGSIASGKRVVVVDNEMCVLGCDEDGRSNVFKEPEPRKSNKRKR